MTSPRRRTFAFVLVGMLLLQAAWILVVPAFRGLDEHDHAYKAAAVARGDWATTHEGLRGQWGELVEVPRDLVTAARPVCESLSYTTSANCTAYRAGPGDRVEVTSSAARYNPVFYFVIGSVARPFSGDAALYAMRAAAAMMCAVMLALAAATLRGQDGQGRWAVVGLVAATSPVVVYSTTVAAPNGLEMASAAVVWAAASRLATGGAGTRGLLAAVTIGAVPLATVRTFGPLWLCLILVVVLVAYGTDHARRLVRRTDARLAAAVIGLAVIGGLAWSATASTNAPPPADQAGAATSVWTVLPGEVLLWLLQSVGAFPARDDPAPLVVYAVVLTGWAVLVGLAARVASRRERAAILTVVAISVLLPSAVTVATYSAVGTAWQGRYSYPVAMGALIVAGIALDRAGVASGRTLRVTGALAATGIAISQVAGQLRVLELDNPTLPLARSADWPVPATISVAVLSITGALALGCAIAGGVPGARRQPVRAPRPDVRVGG
jgi:hypothetical protein